MKIPWLKPSLCGQERTYLLDALNSTRISDGPYIHRFEKEFAKINNSRYCLTTCHGTSALALALLGIGIKPKEEVIVPAFTYIAPVHMILALGAKPVFADIEPDTWCLDPDSVIKLVSRKTKAIIPVHTYGNMCDMDALCGIARARRLRIIEDAAEAALSKFRQKRAGTFGDIGAFSFQAAKNIAMGEGGGILTSQRRLYERMRHLRDRGMTKKRFHHGPIGYNFRLTNLQAALGCAQLKNISGVLQAKKHILDLYRHHLGHEKGICFQEFKPDVSPAIWCVSVAIDPKIFRMSRDAVMGRLSANGIETRPGFPALARHLPNAQRISQRVLCLPSYASLTEREIDHICGRLKKLKNRR